MIPRVCLKQVPSFSQIFAGFLETALTDHGSIATMIVLFVSIEGKNPALQALGRGSGVRGMAVDVASRLCSSSNCVLIFCSSIVEASKHNSEVSVKRLILLKASPY
jgi:hypothetical protein